MWRGRGRRRCPHTIGRGVAQVFHDLLVETRLLLVAEVDEEGQEGSWEVESGESQVEETNTWMTMVMIMTGVADKART